jgi:multisubunit Na+/H+ antiporter MnhG subunit
MPPKVAVFCLLLFELATTFGAAWLAATVCVHFLGTQTHVASMYDIGIALLGAVTASAMQRASTLQKFQKSRD